MSETQPEPSPNPPETPAVSPFPAPRFGSIDPLQEYFEDRDGNRWSVARLIDDTRDLPVFDLPLAGLTLSDRPWEGYDLWELAYHVKKVMEADLSYPILLSWNGAIADGRHRVLKALATGETTIKARRMHWRPEPCRKAQ
ncbi:MAG TPA: hypothetical protein VGK41_01215 [Solirubrobacterales bacterium]